MSNEIEIRDIIKSIFMDFFDGITIDEFGLPSTRPDIAFLCVKYFIAVEIKSDKDTLTRLDSQLNDYSKYFDKVIIVVDVKHKDKAITKYMYAANYPAIFYYENNNIYDTHGRELRDILSSGKFLNFIQKNISLDLHRLLWAEERRQLLKPLGKCPNTREFKALLYCYTAFELDKYSRELILSRWEYLSQQEKRYQNGFKGGKLKNKIKHIGHKKVLLEEFISNKE